MRIAKRQAANWLITLAMLLTFIPTSLAPCAQAVFPEENARLVYDGNTGEYSVQLKGLGNIVHICFAIVVDAYTTGRAAISSIGRPLAGTGVLSIKDYPKSV